MIKNYYLVLDNSRRSYLEQTFNDMHMMDVKFDGYIFFRKLNALS